VAPPVITYRREYRFDLTPEALWDRLGEVDQFETWWSWLSDFGVAGDGLVDGSVLRGTVAPPLPYRMAVEVRLIHVERCRSIDAEVAGDLSGRAGLRLRPDGTGTMAEVAWSVEMHQPAMRLASRFGRPLLQWGHDRVVAVTVAGFRRRVERS
jgi:carbon monoxide dehydrogenase subunit G